LVGTARTQFLRAACFYKGPKRIRFKRPLHFYEAALFFCFFLLKGDLKLPFDLIVIRMILSGEFYWGSQIF
jgi:hypothetical protein